jgi:hypothetical protein
MIQEKSKVKYNSEGRTYLKGKVGTVLQFNHPKTSALVDFEGYSEWVGLGALSEVDDNPLREAINLARAEHAVATKAYAKAVEENRVASDKLTRARRRVDNLAQAIAQLERA